MFMLLFIHELLNNFKPTARLATEYGVMSCVGVVGVVLFVVVVVIVERRVTVVIGVVTRLVVVIGEV